jgi:hypothetical protein
MGIEKTGKISVRTVSLLSRDSSLVPPEYVDVVHVGYMPVMHAANGLHHLSTSITSFNSGSFCTEELTAESFYKYLVKFQKIASYLNYSM